MNARVAIPSREDYPELQFALAEVGHERAVAGYPPFTMLPHEPSWLEAVAPAPEMVGRHVLAQVRAELPLIPMMVETGPPYLQGGGHSACTPRPRLRGPRECFFQSSEHRGGGICFSIRAVPSCRDRHAARKRGVDLP